MSRKNKTIVAKKKRTGYNSDNKTKMGDSSIWSKFKKITDVHIVSNGIFTICKVITEDGVTEFYNWDRAVDREIVRNTAKPDAKITVDPDVKKGWDYGKEQ